MAGFRAYHKNLDSVKVSDIIELSNEESRHLCGSLRAKIGDSVRIFDLFGNVFDTKISLASSKSVKLLIEEKVDLPKKNIKISLAVSLPKGNLFEEIIDIAVQIGADKIYPIISERSIVRLDAKDIEKKSIKWTQTLIEAVKQSGNISEIEIFNTESFANFLANQNEKTLKLIASLEAKNPKNLLEVLADIKPDCEEVLILIGPEGDFSLAEYNKAYACGFLPICLGKNVLRTEVAAMYSLSVISAFLNCGLKS